MRAGRDRRRRSRRPGGRPVRLQHRVRAAGHRLPAGRPGTLAAPALLVALGRGAVLPPVARAAAPGRSIGGALASGPGDDHGIGHGRLPGGIGGPDPGRGALGVLRTRDAGMGAGARRAGGRHGGGYAAAGPADRGRGGSPGAGGHRRGGDRPQQRHPLPGRGRDRARAGVRAGHRRGAGPAGRARVAPADGRSDALAGADLILALPLALAPHRPARGRARGIPADLVPELALARDDLPRIYGDGCHLSVPETASPACVFGSVASEQVIVLFGDSHAAQWFPALERLASSHGWRLVSLTKSSCPVAGVTIWSTSLKREYSECDEWRRAALERIAREHPWLVVISDSREYTLWSEGALVPAAEGGALWNGGLGRTLANLAAVAGRVVLIGDTPRSQVDPPVCLSRHPDDVLACASH